MRFAIVSDIHANLPAWQAVLLDLASLKADQIICLGDVIGYGPHPAEVLESVHAEAHHILLGNHDAALAGLMSDETFNDDARAALAWTRTQLSSQAIEAVRAWPLAARGPGFRCAHAEFEQPARFEYLFEPEEAAASWRAVGETLLFAGHTHVPALFVLGESGVPRRAEVQDFCVERGKRYVVNPGSVGQPRDGDPRASYVLFDSQTHDVFFRRVPFDLDAYARAVAAAGLPSASRAFLDYDPRKGRRPARDFISFHPPAQAEESLRQARPLAEVEALRTTARRWRRLAAVVTFVLIAVLAATWFSWHRHAARTQVIEPAWMPLLHAGERAAGTNLLEPFSSAVNSPASMPGWRIRLNDRTRQTAGVQTGADGPVLVLVSPPGSGDVGVESVPVAVEPGMRLVAELWVKTASAQGGCVMEIIGEDAEGRGVKTLCHKEPSQARAGGRRSARETFDVPSRIARIRMRVFARDGGGAGVISCSLARVPDSGVSDRREESPFARPGTKP